MIEIPKISSKKRCLKVDLLIPDNYQTSTALRELEFLHPDARLSISQPENDEESYYDE